MSRMNGQFPEGLSIFERSASCKIWEKFRSMDKAASLNHSGIVCVLTALLLYILRYSKVSMERVLNDYLEKIEKYLKPLPASVVVKYYRVRKSWEDMAFRLGTYTILTNAKAMAYASEVCGL